MSTSAERGADINEQQAVDAAKQVGVAPGEHIFVQIDGQIMHPHGVDQHVDGWRVENVSGTYVATKCIPSSLMGRQRQFDWAGTRALAGSLASVVFAALSMTVATTASAAPPAGTFSGCPSSVAPLPSNLARYGPDVRRAVLRFVHTSFGKYAKATTSQLMGARVQKTTFVRRWLPSGWVKTECGRAVWERSVASTVYFPRLDMAHNPNGHCNACATVTFLASLTPRGWAVWGRY